MKTAHEESYGFRYSIFIYSIIAILILLGIYMLIGNYKKDVVENTMVVLGTQSNGDEIVFLEDLIRNYPDYIPAYNILADIYETRGNSNAKTDILNRAKEINPNYQYR